MAAELKERLSKEGLIIGVVGPTGVGKSTISKVLGERLRISVIEENFPKNPFLERFYENPKRWSYNSQNWFFLEKIKQLSNVDFNQSQIVDPAIEMDFLYAQTLHKIDLMEKREFEQYETTFKTIYDNLLERKRIRKPDVFLVVNASYNVLEQRIRKRGRPFELIMLEKYPSYLENLKRNVDDFSCSNGIFVDACDDSYINEIQLNSLVEKINKIK